MASLLFICGLAALLAMRRAKFVPRGRVLQVAAIMFPSRRLRCGAQADIFQWEYINPADPSQGKQQSTTLAPDGAGVDAVPGADLAGRDLTMAFLAASPVCHP